MPTNPVDRPCAVVDSIAGRECALRPRGGYCGFLQSHYCICRAIAGVKDGGMDRVNAEVLLNLKSVDDVYQTGAWQEARWLAEDWVVALRAHEQWGEERGWVVQGLFGLAHLEADLRPAVQRAGVDWKTFRLPEEALADCVAQHMEAPKGKEVVKRVVWRAVRALRRSYWREGAGKGATAGRAVAGVARRLRKVVLLGL